MIPAADYDDFRARLPRIDDSAWPLHGAMAARLLRQRSDVGRLKVPLSWKEISKRTAKEFVSDNAFDLGAQQAYYFFFALFPALLTLISIASFFPLANLIDEVITDARAVRAAGRADRSSPIRSRRSPTASRAAC